MSDNAAIKILNSRLSQIAEIVLELKSLVEKRTKDIEDFKNKLDEYFTEQSEIIRVIQLLKSQPGV